MKSFQFLLILLTGTLIAIFGIRLIVVAAITFLNPVEHMPHVEWILLLAGLLFMEFGIYIMTKARTFSRSINKNPAQ